MSIGFYRSRYDSYVHFKKLVDGEFINLLFYVDDMLIAASNVEEIRRVKKQLNLTFEMKDLGLPKGSLIWRSQGISPIKSCFFHKMILPRR